MVNGSNKKALFISPSPNPSHQGRGIYLIYPQKSLKNLTFYAAPTVHVSCCGIAAFLPRIISRNPSIRVENCPGM